MNARTQRMQEWHDREPIAVEGMEPPSDAHAERKVIDAMLAVPGFVDRIHPPLDADHFFGNNREIARGCFEVCERGEAVDAVKLIEWLKANDRLSQVGGAKAVIGPAQLSEGEKREAISAAHLVWDLANRRALALHCQQAVASIYSGQIDSSRAFIESFERRTYEICRTASRSNEASHVTLGLEAVVKSVSSGENPITVPSGLDAYDKAIGEMWLGEMSIVGATTGNGKSSFAINAMVAAAKRGFGGLYVSTEMTHMEIAQRMIAAESSVPMYLVRRPKILRDEQRSRILAASDRLRQLPMHVDAEPFGQSLASIRAQARRIAPELKQRGGAELRFIVVDYLQDLRMPAVDRASTEEQRLRGAASGLKDLAVELKAHVLALSQLTPKATTKDWEPDIADLAGAKAIARPASSVVFIHREETETKEARSIAKLIVRKSRNGGRGRRTVMFDGPIARFEDGDPEPGDER